MNATTPTAITLPDPRRELARRMTGGIEVTLYWCALDDSVSVEVWQPATDERLTVAVPGEQALDAFHHPFAHLRDGAGIELALPVSSAASDVNHPERTS